MNRVSTERSRFDPKDNPMTASRHASLVLAAFATALLAAGVAHADGNPADGGVWDEKTLDAYLADPRGFIKGNKMAFPGLKKEDEREDVIAYLKTATE
jgi:cytochrome c2